MRRRRTALVAVLAGLVLGLPVLPAAAAASATRPTDPMSAARQQAKDGGHRVRVAAKTTQTTTIDANPDGTFTETTHLLPVRVKKNGAWTKVDATLALNGDGTYSPAATPNAVKLSGGGTGPLVTLTHADGPSMRLTLPFALPTPQVSGDTALYKAVLPGVDLSVSVTDQGGFSDVLIVHNATAAADPRLKTLTLAATTHGLSLKPTPSGGMQATKVDGTLAYTSPRPLMWDSSAKAAPKAALATPAGGTTETHGNSGRTAPSSAHSPGTGAHVAPIAMKTGSGGLTLTPDQSVLTDPGTTYPVYIDPYTNPVSSTAGHYDEVYSSSTCHDAPQYDKPQTGGEGVGYQRWGGSCGTGLERTYYAIDTSGLHSSFVIYDAKVAISTTYAASFSCSQDQPITLHTTDAISSSTDWDSRPGTHDVAFPTVTTHVPSGANPSSSCSNSTATFTVTDEAQKIADQDGDGYNASGTFGAQTNAWTIGLYGDEDISSSNTDYLRTSQTLTLTTKFDIAPNTPTSLRTVPAATGASSACTTSGDGWIGATTYSDAGSNVKLHATVTSNVSGELVAAHFHVWDRSVLDSGGNAADKTSPATSYLASGSDASASVGFTLLDGHEYGWDVYSETNSTLHLKSSTSDHCWFKTDLTAPATPAVDANPSFPPVGSGSANPIVYAGSGKTTSFTVHDSDNPAADSSCTPNACLTSGIDHFLWKLDTPPTAADSTTAAVSGTSNGVGTATITVPINTWGVHTLYVAGVDKAGNISTAPTSYTYTVPWNPATKATSGDVTGDGVPDLLTTTKGGSLLVVPGDTDPAQPATQPTSPTTSSYTGPLTAADSDHTPAATSGDSWANYLIAHHGSLTGHDVDDLFALHTTSSPKQLYLVPNDVNYDTTTYGYSNYANNKSHTIAKPSCQSSTPADRCTAADYTTDWNATTKIAAPGDVYGTGLADLITIENGHLWLYQGRSGGTLVNPVLLGDGDWSDFDLLSPGTVNNTPTLWARNRWTGVLYTFPLTIDTTTTLPPLLHAPVSTPLQSAVVPSTDHLCLDVRGYNTDDGTPMEIYTCNGTHAQRFSLLTDNTLRVYGKCVTVAQGGTADHTPVELDHCTGSAAQQWTPSGTGSLTNPQSGRCLDDPSASTATSTQVQIYTCNGTAAQNWTSSANTGWDTNSASALTTGVPTLDYPLIATDGDTSSPAGGPDGHPDLYTTDTSGQLLLHPGGVLSNGLPTLTTPVSLGSVTDAAQNWWNLDEGTGTTLTDTRGSLDATLTGDHTWTTDTTHGTVLNLDGTTGYAATSGPAVDSSKSFSVSAWVKLNSLTANSTFVSQSDTAGNANGFQLYYSSYAHAFAFNRHNDDTTGDNFSAAYGGTPTTGTWTHLVGVYDATTTKLSLYVDGHLAATQDYTGTTWNAAGNVQIGRRLYQSSYGEYTDGELSDIRLYDTALPAADAAATNDLPQAVRMS
ncbi:LamG-like jellyroll fold domain-containing protein [Streptomyces sp. NPDC047028]|uniref:LamG-like jellyroll fold domain-containing protein n=1 Tax=Streptomyces sp. NPDC047028 TaxID=3155793 RepID=UPI0034105C54